MKKNRRKFDIREEYFVRAVWLFTALELTRVMWSLLAWVDSVFNLGPEQRRWNNGNLYGYPDRQERQSGVCRPRVDRRESYLFTTHHHHHPALALDTLFI